MGVLRPWKRLTKWSSWTSSGSEPRGFETVSHAQTPEAPRIDKAQFPARSQLRDQRGCALRFRCPAGKPACARSSPGERSTGQLIRGCGAGALARRFVSSDGTARLVPPLGGRGRPPHTTAGSRSNTMCFPTRRTPAMRCDSRVATISAAGDFSGSGFDPSQTDSMTSPVTRLARPRAMVSTSGSSGMENSLQSSVFSRQPSALIADD